MMDSMGVRSPSLLEDPKDAQLSKEITDNVEETRRKLAGITMGQKSGNNSTSQCSWESQDSAQGLPIDQCSSTATNSLSGSTLTPQTSWESEGPVKGLQANEDRTTPLSTDRVDTDFTLSFSHPENY
jgi:hypothetical protein